MKRVIKIFKTKKMIAVECPALNDWILKRECIGCGHYNKKDKCQYHDNLLIKSMHMLIGLDKEKFENAIDYILNKREEDEINLY